LVNNNISCGPKNNKALVLNFIIINKNPSVLRENYASNYTNRLYDFAQLFDTSCESVAV